MKITCFNEKYKAPTRCVGVFGCFDGVHKGHAQLIKRAVDYSIFQRIPVVVWMLSISRDDMILSDEEKLTRIAALGVDAVISENFDDIRDMSSLDFLSRVKNEFGISEFFCGYNFTFGKNRCGNTQNLARLCETAGISSHIVPEYSLNYCGKQINVSSSSIRSALRLGDISLARFILGQDVSYSGTVTHGEALGRKMGFPTANIIPDENLIMPRFGVYATILDCDGHRYPAITDIGTRPTFERKNVLIESYITVSDEKIELYGKRIRVTLLAFLRDEKQFSNPEELIDQIKKDISVCSEYHRKYSDI